MKKKTLFLILLFGLTLSTYSKSITGRVVDTEGNPIIGASIVVKNKSLGTSTDIDGKYKINAEKNDMLYFSYIGMISVSRTVGSESIINITMKQSNVDLDEVVVVGYGTMKKSDLTGSLSSVDMSKVEESGAQNIMQVLQGKVSGVNVIANTGVPGSMGSVTIRGISSMSTDSQPLYVIDGIIMDFSPMTDGEQTAINPLQNISPEDIESIEVLKDASATAIYGSRGANGVILITTKQAKKGSGGKVNLSLSVGLSKVIRRLDVMDYNTYGQYINEMIALGLPQEGAIKNFPVDEKGNIILDNTMQAHDWQDEYFERAISQNYRLSFQNGKDKSSSYISVGYQSADGVIKNTGMEKYDFRGNYKNEIKKWLTVTTTTAGAYIKNKFTTGATNSATSSIVRSMYLTRPLLSGSDLTDKGEVDDESMVNTVSSPDAWIKNHQNNITTKVLSSSLTADLKLLKWLSFRTQLSTNYNNETRLLYYGKTLQQGRPSGVGYKNSNENLSYAWDNLFMFNYEIKKKHRLNGTIGITYDRHMTQRDKYSAAGFIDDFQKGNALHGSSESNIEYANKWRYSLLSGLLRANYNFDDRLLLTATFRADGSSKFAKGNQWGYFPSFSLAYNFHKQFLSDVDWISRLKFRAGWGQVGNSPSPVYATVSQYKYVKGSNAEGSSTVSIMPMTKGNPDLTWEFSEQTNIGLDFGFWNNRILGGIDLYYKVTKNQIQNVPLAPETGFENMWMNRGTVENKGVDLELSGILFSNTNWNISMGANISAYRNKIFGLGLTPDEFGQVYFESANIGKASGFVCSPNVYYNGKPIGAFWGYKTNGIIYDAGEAAQAPTFNGQKLEPGDIKFIDVRGKAGNLNKDGDVTIDDKCIIGDPNPDFTYGFNFDISYKRLSLSCIFSGSKGNEILNANAIMLQNFSGDAGGAANNKLKNNYLNAWRPNAPSREYPRLMQNSATVNSIITDRMIEDGSYFKLSQLTLSYIFKIKKYGNASLKLFGTANNLFYCTKYSGYTPEIQRRSTNTIIGVDLYNFPDARSFLLGLNVSF